MPSPIQNPRLLLSQCRLHLPPKHLRFPPISSRRHLSTTASLFETLTPTSPPPSNILSTSDYLSRLRRAEPQLKSFLQVAVTEAMAAAEEVDKSVERGEEVGPLAGVVVAVKDNICTADMPSTGGSRILEGYRPAFDATAVRRMREAGAVVVGKTNLDEFGMGSTTEGSGFRV